MKYFTKICGVTELEDLKEICELKVSAIGFNSCLLYTSPSPRDPH